MHRGARMWTQLTLRFRSNSVFRLISFCKSHSKQWMWNFLKIKSIYESLYTVADHFFSDQFYDIQCLWKFVFTVVYVWTCACVCVPLLRWIWRLPGEIRNSAPSVRWMATWRKRPKTGGEKIGLVSLCPPPPATHNPQVQLVRVGSGAPGSAGFVTDTASQASMSCLLPPRPNPPEIRSPLDYVHTHITYACMIVQSKWLRSPEPGAWLRTRPLFRWLVTSGRTNF